MTFWDYCVDKIRPAYQISASIVFCRQLVDLPRVCACMEILGLRGAQPLELQVMPRKMISFYNVISVSSMRLRSTCGKCAFLCNLQKVGGMAQNMHIFVYRFMPSC